MAGSRQGLFFALFITGPSLRVPRGWAAGRSGKQKDFRIFASRMAKVGFRVWYGFIIVFSLWGGSAHAADNYLEALRKDLQERVGRLIEQDSVFDFRTGRKVDSLWKADVARPGGMPDTVLLEWIYRAGYSSVEKGRHVQVTRLFSDALEYISQAGLEDREVGQGLKIGLGAIYEEMGLWTRAMNLYFEVLDFSGSENRQRGNVFNNIANVYFKQGYYDRAKAYYDSAVAVYRRLDDKKNLVNAYNNMSALYYTQDDLERTSYFLSQAMAQIDPAEDPDSYYVLLQNLAVVYNRQGKKEIARNFMHEVIRYQESKSRNYDLIHSWLSLARSFGEEKPDSTLYYIELAKEKADLLQNPAAQILSLQALYDWNKAHEHYRTACTILEKLVDMQDSLAQLDNRMRIESIEAANAIEQDNQNKDIALQKMQIEKLQTQKRELGLVVVLVVFVVVIFVLFYHYRSQKKLRKKNEEISRQQEDLHEREKRMMDLREKELEDTLELKNRELTAKVLHLVKNNEYISDITRELQKLLLELNPKDTAKKAHIREIIVKLRNQGNEGTYEEFKYYFEQVHQSFYKNLSEAYPELTYKDMRLCSFLKLGLSSKEIASITFTEVRSVESARNRLRKKMNLDPDINLIEFFARF